MMRIGKEEIESSRGFGAYVRIAAEKRLDLFRQFRGGERVTPRSSVWRQFKKDILRVLTRGRCMYCEWPVEGASELHVEHYRPKGAVTETSLDHLSRQRCKLPSHGGYWWLSYEWQNLTLVCGWCNTYHSEAQPSSVMGGTDETSFRETWDTHPGKGNEFPIRGKRIVRPCEDPISSEDVPEVERSYQAPASWWAELRNERALLLHPYEDDPFEHFELDDQIGVLKAKTLEATWTIAVCDLNRPSLVEARAKAAASARRRIQAMEEAVEELEEDREDREFSKLLRDLRPRERLAPSRGKGFSFYVALYLKGHPRKQAA